jgi:signal transduction histidine kinase
MFCTDIPQPLFYIFSEFTPQILYYSHIPTALIALILAFFLLSKERSRRSWLLLSTTVLFALWSISDIVLWTNSDSRIIMFVWSYINLLQTLTTISFLLFVCSFISDRPFPKSLLYFIGIILLPKVLFLSTPLNIPSFDLTICEATEGAFVGYYYTAEIIILALIIGILGRTYFKSVKGRRSEILLFSIGAILFTLSFSGANLIASYTGNWEILQYGLFGMPIFLSFLIFNIIKFQKFKLRVAASLVLSVSMWFLVFSLLFIREVYTARVILALTLLILTVLGAIFFQQTRREMQQKQAIEKLAENLERANIRLRQVDKLKSEFVSIASHQLRSPLTSISGYASLIREGTYGKLPDKMAEPVERIEQSARRMAESIEDYLNVSRIESGNMKFHLTDFSLRDEAEHICDDLRAEALKNGLILLFRTDLTSKGIINADIGKVQQIIHNLINNAIKYTQRGTITVYLRDDKAKKRIYVEILDTGIGMGTETLHSIFQKFERGDKANSVNVKGTGLGLYVALKMAEAMGGTITAHSKGEGEGSRFVIDLPLQM